MGRPLREFAAGEIYHVYNQGVRKQEIFREDANYQRFLERSRTYAVRDGAGIMAYTLIPNHYHFLIQQRSDTPLTLFLLRLQTSYARYVNIKYRESGHLFEKRFQARRVTSDAYLFHLTRYIHLNPGQHRASAQKAVQLSRIYRWSSCAAYLGEREDPVLDWDAIRAYIPADLRGKTYEKFLLSAPWPPPEDEPVETDPMITRQKLKKRSLAPASRNIALVPPL